MQFSLRLKEQCVVSMHRKKLYTICHTSTLTFHRQTVGTGFIGYAKYKDKYITVLVTASHVIPTFEDAKASRITFENILPDNKKIFLKGFEVFTGEFWTSPMRQV